MLKILIGAVTAAALALTLYVFARRPEPSALVKEARAEAPARPLPPPADSSFILDTTSLHIYLTFDDGPYKTTPLVLPVLEREAVKSSFLVVGKQVHYCEEYRLLFDSLRRDPWIRVYNHTYTHGINQLGVKRYYRKPQRVLEDMRRNHDTLQLAAPISRLPGVNAWYTRGYKDPYARDAKPLFRLLDSIRSPEHIMGWDLEWSFVHMQSPDRIYDEILAAAPRGKVRNHLVLLMHDFQFDNRTRASGLDTVIQRLKAVPGLQFHWLEEHPLARGWDPARSAIVRR